MYLLTAIDIKIRNLQIKCKHLAFSMQQKISQKSESKKQCFMCLELNLCEVQCAWHFNEAPNPLNTHDGCTLCYLFLPFIQTFKYLCTQAV